jgi:hypothetical protein
MPRVWKVSFNYTRNIHNSLDGNLFNASLVCFDYQAAEDLAGKLRVYGSGPAREPVVGDKGVLMVHGRAVPFGCVFGVVVKRMESESPHVEFEQDSCLESELDSLVLR